MPRLERMRMRQMPQLWTEPLVWNDCVCRIEEVLADRHAYQRWDGCRLGMTCKSSAVGSSRPSVLQSGAGSVPGNPSEAVEGATSRCGLLGILVRVSMR